MERKHRIIAALADLNLEYTGNIPAEIMKRWLTEKKTVRLEESILYPFRRKGYLVDSDSSGLSKLSREKGLVEVMKIVSLPKEIIFAYGRAIGGRGIGVWAADNTQMFYEESVKAEELVEQMVSAQKEITLKSQLQVGIGLQFGDYLEIGQSFFGRDAEIIDEVTENHTDAQDILLSESIKGRLGETFQNEISRALENEIEWPFYKLNYDGMGISAKRSPEWNYPIPFSEEFYDYLRGAPAFNDNDRILQKYLFKKVVVLVKVYHPERKFFLDQLADWMVMNNLLLEFKREYDVEVVKSNGDLGIFVSNDPLEAISFAEAVLSGLQESGDPVSVGVSFGDVLVFDLPSGGKDIAGDPVNIASKISEDIDERDSLYIHDSVNLREKNLSHYQPFSILKSHVPIQGVKFVA